MKRPSSAAPQNRPQARLVAIGEAGCLRIMGYGQKMKRPVSQLIGHMGRWAVRVDGAVPDVWRGRVNPQNARPC